MARVHRIRTDSAARGLIHLYGWDARSRIWHGPNELGKCAPDRKLLHSLWAAPGNSWYGPISCCASGEPDGGRFFVLVHDLSDCAIAALYCDETKAGPAEILVVIPGARRAQLREEFAFEFLAFTRFLGSVTEGDELQVHEAMTAAIAGEPGSIDCVFSISSGLLSDDNDIMLSRCAEKVAVTLFRWLADSPIAAKRPDRGSVPAA